MNDVIGLTPGGHMGVVAQGEACEVDHVQPLTRASKADLLCEPVLVKTALR